MFFGWKYSILLKNSCRILQNEKCMFWSGKAESKNKYVPVVSMLCSLTMIERGEKFVTRQYNNHFKISVINSQYDACMVKLMHTTNTQETHDINF